MSLGLKFDVNDAVKAYQSATDYSSDNENKEYAQTKIMREAKSKSSTSNPLSSIMGNPVVSKIIKTDTIDNNTIIDAVTQATKNASNDSLIGSAINKVEDLKSEAMSGMNSIMGSMSDIPGSQQMSSIISSIVAPGTAISDNIGSMLSGVAGGINSLPISSGIAGAITAGVSTFGSTLSAKNGLTGSLLPGCKPHLDFKHLFDLNLNLDLGLDFNLDFNLALPSLKGLFGASLCSLTSMNIPLPNASSPLAKKFGTETLGSALVSSLSEASPQSASLDSLKNISSTGLLTGIVNKTSSSNNILLNYANSAVSEVSKKDISSTVDTLSNTLNSAVSGFNKSEENGIEIEPTKFKPTDSISKVVKQSDLQTVKLPDIPDDDEDDDKIKPVETNPKKIIAHTEDAKKEDEGFFSGVRNFFSRSQYVRDDFDDVD